jgi:hypothetical protein
MYNIKLVFFPFSVGGEHRNYFPANGPGYEIDHALPYSAIMNNEWMFTSMSLISMISWRAQGQLYILVYILLRHYIWGIILQLLNFKSLINRLVNFDKLQNYVTI